MRRVIKVGVLLVLAAGILGVVMLQRTLRYGFSARDEPTAMEALLARTMRHYSVPAELRDHKNPVPLTPAVVAEARAHFADHCASCHGNDGKGKTSLGQSFYPKAPDMTSPETQDQSDGALFATIENGIRLTGMPAWGNGTAESAYGSWTLVHFIRHLPKLTPEEIAEMEKLNPRSPEEFATMQAEAAFLAGEAAAPPPPASDGHGHGH